MDSIKYAYGNWIVAVSIIIVALFFVTKYIPLKTKFQKRSGGVLIAFIISLFAEMYGFPLTIYFLSSFLGVRVPLTHEYGHLFAYLLTFFGINIVYGWIFVMVVSTVLIVIGLGWIMEGWKLVYKSEGKLVTSGIYAKMRHPQYSGIILVAIGFLIQWPTLVTIILFPFLVSMYYRLARREERDVETKYRAEYDKYKQQVSMFVPKLNLNYKGKEVTHEE